MNKIHFGILMILAVLPQALFSQQPGFEISGHLDGLKDGETVALGNRFADDRYLTITDSCKVIHGDFHLKGGGVPGGPRLYEIVFDEGRHRKHPLGEDRNAGGITCLLLVDNGQKIVIHGGDINKMRDSEFSGEVSIEGSPTTTAMEQLIPLYINYSWSYSLISDRMDKVQDSVGFDPSLLQGYMDAKFALDDALGRILKGPISLGHKPAIPFLLAQFENYHADFLPYVYESLDAAAKNSYYGKILRDNARLAIGQPLPGFTLPTIENKMVSLKDVDSKSKITLVHIWASNSVRKEKYQKELKIAYKRYHDKGLDIVGVSADTAEEDWRKWVLVEQFPWVNVSDLKGHMKGGIVQDVYHEGGHYIPNTTNILLDSEGKIIAWDVNGPELFWYLKKIFGE